jgi:hypothetical protein
VSNFGYRSLSGTRGDINVFTTVGDPNGVLQLNPDSPDNTNAVPVMTDSTGRVLKRSRISDDGLVVSVVSDSFNVTGNTTTSFIESTTGAQIGTDEMGYTLPAERGSTGELMHLGADGKLEWSSKTLYMNVDPEDLPSKTVFNSGIECVDIECEDIDSKIVNCTNVKFGGGIYGDNWYALPSATLRIFAEDGGTEIRGEVTVTQDLLCQGQVQSTDGLSIGATPTNYTFPSTRGLTGQSLQLMSTGDTAWITYPSLSRVSTLESKTLNISSVFTGVDLTLFSGKVEAESFRVSGGGTVNRYTLPLVRGTQGQFLIADGATGENCTFSSKNVLPDINATSANQTLMSTNASGGYAWTQPGTASMWRNVTETVPPTGTQVPVNTIKTNFLATVTNARFSNGVATFFPPNNFIAYNGVFTRSFTATFSCDIQGDNKDNPTIALSLENQTSAIILSRSHAQIVNNAFRHFTLTGTGTVDTNDRLVVFISANTTSTCVIHNANFTFTCM